MTKNEKSGKGLINRINNLSNSKKLFSLATTLIIVPIVIGIMLIIIHVDPEQIPSIVSAVLALAVGVTGVIISIRLLWSELKTRYKVICFMYTLYFIYLILGSIVGFMLSSITWGAAY